MTDDELRALAENCASMDDTWVRLQMGRHSAETMEAASNCVDDARDDRTAHNRQR